ncbi:MAG: glycosyltransferase [Pseudomonadota bacterium]
MAGGNGSTADDGAPGAGGVPSISVIIPHLNQPDLLARCLACIAAQEPGAYTLGEVIVADNGSRAERHAATVCRDFAFARAIDAAAVPGPGPARNAAVAQATGDLLVFTDSDCLPRPGWLAGYARAFAEHPAPVVFGGEITIAQSGPQPTSVEAYESVFSFRAEKYIRRDGYAATANMATRRPTMAAVGPFGGIDLAEDRDWGNRARRSGLPLRFVPQAAVEHPARASVGELTRKWERLIAHDWAEVAAGRRGRVAWVAKAVALALSPLGELPRILLSHRVSGPAARWSAFRVLARLRLFRAARMLGSLREGRADSAAAWRRP